jgi:hypothetical protein
MEFCDVSLQRQRMRDLAQLLLALALQQPLLVLQQPGLTMQRRLVTHQMRRHLTQTRDVLWND